MCIMSLLNKFGTHIDDCLDLTILRQNYYAVTTMKELFDTVHFKYTIALLKESHIFHKI